MKIRPYCRIFLFDTKYYYIITYVVLHIYFIFFDITLCSV